MGGNFGNVTEQHFKSPSPSQCHWKKSHGATEITEAEKGAQRANSCFWPAVSLRAAFSVISVAPCDHFKGRAAAQEAAGKNYITIYFSGRHRQRSVRAGGRKKA
jgi:hypothetical protein